MLIETPFGAFLGRDELPHISNCLVHLSILFYCELANAPSTVKNIKEDSSPKGIIENRTSSAILVFERLNSDSCYGFFGCCLSRFFFASCSCFFIFCFCILFLSFLPPLSPIVCTLSFCQSTSRREARSCVSDSGFAYLVCTEGQPVII